MEKKNPNGQFVIKDLEEVTKEKGVAMKNPVVAGKNSKRFYVASNTAKEDAHEAFKKLLGKDKNYAFFTSSIGRGKKLVEIEGKNNHRPGVRIDVQEDFKEEIGGRQIDFANVQIQMNMSSKGTPTSIAQVHFEYGVNIPGETIQEAFERSLKALPEEEAKKIIYVYWENTEKEKPKKK